MKQSIRKHVRRYCTKTVLNERTNEKQFEEVKQISSRRYLPPGHWKLRENRKSFISQFINEHEGLDSLYRLTVKDIVRAGGRGLLWYYHDSVPHAVVSEFPEHPWKPWLFVSATPHWWTVLGSRFFQADQISQRLVSEFISHVGERLGVKDINDWQRVDLSQLDKPIRLRLTKLGPLNAILQALYQKRSVEEPQISSNLITKTVSKSWKENCRKCLDDILVSLTGHNNPSGFYQITQADLMQHHAASTIVSKYGQGLVLADAVVVEYPEYHWQVWRFSSPPRGWFSTLGDLFYCGDAIAMIVVRQFVEDVVSVPIDVLIKSYPDDIDENIVKEPYSIFVTRLGGIRRIVERFASYVSEPTVLLPFSRGVLPTGYWNDKSRHKQYFDHLKSQLGGKMESLYQVTQRIVLQTGGASLLSHYYNNSVLIALMNIYPEHQWCPWLFATSPRGWWSNLARNFKTGDEAATRTVRQYVEYIARSVGLRDVSEWDNTTVRKLSIREIKRLDLLGGAIFVLTKAFPEYDWKFGSKGQAQAQLRQATSTLFPEENSECI